MCMVVEIWEAAWTMIVLLASSGKESRSPWKQSFCNKRRERQSFSTKSFVRQRLLHDSLPRLRYVSKVAFSCEDINNHSTPEIGPVFRKHLKCFGIFEYIWHRTHLRLNFWRICSHFIVSRRRQFVTRKCLAFLLKGSKIVYKICGIHWIESENDWLGFLPNIGGYWCLSFLGSDKSRDRWDFLFAFCGGQWTSGRFLSPKYMRFSIFAWPTFKSNSRLTSTIWSQIIAIPCSRPSSTAERALKWFGFSMIGDVPIMSQ